MNYSANHCIQLFTLLRRLVEKEGITILATTHDPLIDEYADLVYRLEDGRLAQVQ